jgi:hypothetical protein
MVRKSHIWRHIHDNNAHNQIHNDYEILNTVHDYLRSKPCTESPGLTKCFRFSQNVPFVIRLIKRVLGFVTVSFSIFVAKARQKAIFLQARVHACRETVNETSINSVNVSFILVGSPKFDTIRV